MSDRQKTRARRTRRHTFAPSYGAILEEGVRRRSVLKGFLAAMGAAALSPALETAHAEAAGSSLTFPELRRVRDTADHWPEGYERHGGCRHRLAGFQTRHARPSVAGGAEPRQQQCGRQLKQLRQSARQFYV
ncbi:hypothetical protein [Rhizobium leguminosarum]|uniref:hypothetical protein n=1 Tax=Rhizobium leguminosarum TaxID=384 RepID=UPI0021BC15E0|nr:hypothetical protein [Rhizobium leguminosarum]